MSLQTKLVNAVRNLEYENVIALLKQGADPNQLDETGSLALVDIVRTYSSERENFIKKNIRIEIARVLLDTGADPNKYDRAKKYPLYLACENGYSEMAQLLLKYGANPNQIDQNTNSCLWIAGVNQYPEIVGLLLQYGADPNYRNNRGYGLIHSIVFRPDTEFENRKKILEILLGQNRKYLVLFREFFEESLLNPDYLALDMFKIIIKSSIPLTDPDLTIEIERKTALILLSLNSSINENEKIELMKILLDNSADPNIKDSGGRSVLHYAVSNEKNINIVKLLLIERMVLDRKTLNDPIWNVKITKADPNIEDDYEKTPLDVAIRVQNNDAIVLALLENGAIVKKSARDYDDGASGYGYFEKYAQVIKKLKLGSKVNIGSIQIAFDLDKNINPNQNIEVRLIQSEIIQKSKYYVLRDKIAQKMTCNHVHSNLESLKNHLGNTPDILCPSCHIENQIFASFK